MIPCFGILRLAEGYNIPVQKSSDNVQIGVFGAAGLAVPQQYLWMGLAW